MGAEEEQEVNMTRDRFAVPGGAVKWRAVQEVALASAAFVDGEGLFGGDGILIAIGVEHVILFALIGILQNLIRLDHAHEFVGDGGIGIHVGMEFFGANVEGFADVFESGGGFQSEGPIIIGERGFSADHAGGNIGPVRHLAGAAEIFDVVDQAGAEIDEGEAGLPGAQADAADVDDAGLGDGFGVVGAEGEGDDLAAADGGFAPAAQADSAGGEVDDIAQGAGDYGAGEAGIPALVDEGLGSRFGAAQKLEHTPQKSAIPVVRLTRKIPPQIVPEGRSTKGRKMLSTKSTKIHQEE